MRIAITISSLLIASTLVAQTSKPLHELEAYAKEKATKEKGVLLKRHYETLAYFVQDTTHGFQISSKDSADAVNVLLFLKGDGAKWETYVNGPRPLMMSFVSPTDNKRSYYWLFLPKGFDPKKNDYPFFFELHGSGGGTNNNPRKMLFLPLQPTIAGVPNEGYRKEGFYVYPWGRGDKGYRDVAETDVFEVLNDFDAMFKTNRKRQYIYGFSMGGAGTFRLALKNKERWTAIAVYSGGLGSVTQETIDKYKGLPLWLTWGEKEERLAKENPAAIDMLNRADIEVKWIEVKDTGHKYLGEYQEDMLNWLIAHSK